MLANQPKNDTLYIKGFNIVVENRAFTYRQVAQNVGQKACLMPAHYGYLQNNPKVGVFVGAFPENDTVYLINQKAQGGYFDKHIAMFGFLSEQQAVDTYQKCFEYGYIGLMSVIPCTIEQLKWWLINGDKSRPVTKERLPYAGLERLDSVLWGGEDKADLASHSGQVAKLLYQIRQSDNFNHALEPLSYHDLTQELGNQGFVYENYDALVIEYNKLERKAKQMLMAMQGAADIVKPVGVAVSKPLNKGGVSNVVAWFEMEDGQAVGVFFHNPDKTPKKIDPTDEMISYKWVLNKKDITIVVAPENGKDLVIRTVAKRIMKLVDANHNLFLKANSDKAELNLKEQNLNAQVIEKQAELDALNKEIEALEAQKAEKEAQPSGEQLLNTGYDGIKAELKGMAWVDDPIVQGGLVKSFIGAQESGDTNPDGILSISINRNGVNIAAKVGADTIIPNSVELIPQYGIDAQSTQNYKKVADKINNAVEAYVAKQRELVTLTGKELENPTLPQERPSNWRTNLANARAVAKSLGIETKGKKLADLVENIKLKDEANIIDAAIDDILTKLRLPVGFEAKKDSKHKMSYFTPVSLTNTETGEKLVIKILPSNSIAGYAATFSNESIKDDKALKAIDEYTGISQATIELLVEKLTGLINHELELNPPNAIQPESEPPKANPDRDLLGFATMAALSTQTKQERDKKKSPDFVANTLAEKWTKALNGDSKAIKDIRDYFVSNKRVPNMTKAHLIILEGLTGQDFNSKTYEYVVQKFDDYINTITQSQEPVATNPDRDLLDFALVTFSSWKKNGKHRIYLKLSEKDNAFNKMDYGANDLGYLEIIKENGSEKINNLSTVSNYSQLKDKVIGGAFVDALQEYLSKKDIDISDFNISTLKVKIKSDADVLTEKKATADAQANAEAQEKQAKQDKIDLQQAIIKENIAKFGMDAVVNDLSDASLGNKAKVDAVLAGTFLMSDKDFNSFLSFQKSAKPIITNHPDRDYLQSIIDGKADLSNANEIEAKLTDISERLDADLEPLFEQAAEAFAQYAIAQAATV